MDSVATMVEALQFAWPLALLLLSLPALLHLLSRGKPSINSQGSSDVSAAPALLMPQFSAVRQVMESRGFGQARHKPPSWRLWMLTASWIFLCVSLTRPQWHGEPVPLDTSARDLLLTVDISPSMQEPDMVLKGYQTDRLTALKQVVSDFLKQRDGDRVGLILFGAKPYIQAPLTFDLATVEQLLYESQIGLAGNATAIGDAIGLGIKRLRERPADARVMVLLTDGAELGSEVDPIKAAELAREAGLRIYTIGLGADEAYRAGLFGRQRYNPSADLDENLLRHIAQTTGGEFYRARSTSELELVYEAINQLEPVRQDGRIFRPVTEYFWVPLIGALLLLIVALLPVPRRLRAVLVRIRDRQKVQA
tara:strand:+ start:53927 stop:55021 length:1095 start_codon:yes stop_codon:yes gene_type:complete